MSAASLPKLLTVDEFDRLPNPPGGVYELRHGELFFVSFPEKIHKELQRRLRKIIEAIAEQAGVPGVTDTEFPYRPFPEHELWSADVAFVSQERYDRIDRWLLGSPELVIEVKSPSNRKQELNDKALTALAGGAYAVWIVDHETRSVTVFDHRNGMCRYQEPDAVPLELFPAVELPLSMLFPQAIW
ncbi:MAG TPA: Uma2 family endonuclease [Bryobacteraceae bacterium]|nr:Uma2 family endonuclease [Bryobacteraceae bacterium]